MTYDLGFLGGGQLARMSIHAAQRMGLRCLSLDPGRDGPAAQVADSRQGALDDAAAVAEVIRDCRAVTLENEFIPAQTIRQALELAGRDEGCLTPGPDVLATIQDKMRQREAYSAHGAPSPKAVPAEQAADLSFPCVLKARFGGYDGKGVRYAKTEADYEELRPEWEQGGWLAEEHVDFDRELAVMVCRSRTETACFPTMETIQANHVCDLVFPSDADASEAAIAAVEAVGGYGLFGVELFDIGGAYLINEIAPRPHNTGHYTLDWGGASQFDQHVRLAVGLPLAPINGKPCAMANLLGQEGLDYQEGIARALQVEPDSRVHWYGKAQMRAGRKMGHLNVPGHDCRQRAERARRAFFGA